MLAPIRRNIVRTLASDLPTEEQERLVIGTRGLVEPEIREAVRLWSKTGAMPWYEGANKRVPRHPITGQYFERPLAPMWVLGELRAVGFRARLIRPDFTCIFMPGKLKLGFLRIAGFIISITHPVSLFMSPWLEVLGEKPKGAINGLSSRLSC